MQCFCQLASLQHQRNAHDGHTFLELFTVESTVERASSFAHFNSCTVHTRMRYRLNNLRISDKHDVRSPTGRWVLRAAVWIRRLRHVLQRRIHGHIRTVARRRLSWYRSACCTNHDTEPQYQRKQLDVSRLAEREHGCRLGCRVDTVRHIFVGELDQHTTMVVDQLLRNRVVQHLRATVCDTIFIDGWFKLRAYELLIFQLGEHHVL